MEGIFQESLGLGLGGKPVTIFGHEAFCRRENGAIAIALDASAFEDEREAALVFIGVQTVFKKPLIDEIILVGGELHAPSVELEIDERGICLAVSEGDETVISRPGVVDWADKEMHLCRQGLAEDGTDTSLIVGDNEKRLETGYGIDDVDIATLDLVHHVIPI